MNEKTDYTQRIWLYGFRFQGILGSVALGRKNITLRRGFNHVKGYAGFAADKPRGCSEHVLFDSGIKAYRYQNQVKHMEESGTCQHDRTKPLCMMIPAMQFDLLPIQCHVSVFHAPNSQSESLGDGSSKGFHRHGGKLWINVGPSSWLRNINGLSCSVRSMHFL